VGQDSTGVSADGEAHPDPVGTYDTRTVGTYDKRTHVAVSKSLLFKLLDALEGV